MLQKKELLLFLLIFKGTKDDLHGPKKVKLLLFMFTNFQWTLICTNRRKFIIIFWSRNIEASKRLMIMKREH